MLCFLLEDGKVSVWAKDKSDIQAVMTAELVTEVFNLKNTGMRIYRSEMRFQELTQEMNKLYDSIEELQSNPESHFLQRKLQALLRRESRFAAFKRNYIRAKWQMYCHML